MADSRQRECGSCGAAIRWGETTTGGRMPLDFRATSSGNVWIRPDGKLRVLSAIEAGRARANAIVLWMPHHATCVKPKRHTVPRAQETLDL